MGYGDVRCKHLTGSIVKADIKLFGDIPKKIKCKSVGSIFLIVLLGMIYYFDHSTEGMDIHNLTIFFTFFVMLQFWNLFNARVFGTTDSAFKGLSKSYGMELIVLAILAGQFLIVQFGGAVFRTEPLNWQTWLLIIGVSSTVLWVGELVRLVQRIIHKKDRNEK